MKKIQYLLVPSILIAAFIIWTALVKVIDIQYIGAAGFLGFYHLNTQINDFVQSMNTKAFDILTDVMMFAAIATIIPFAILGIIQLIKRKDLKKVDSLIYIILAGYIGFLVLYFVFEIMKINFSPLSTEEDLKASYPSSHVMIFIIMGGAAVMGLLHYVKMNKALKITINFLFVVLALLMAGLRLLSGQHYFTDIIGGLLASFTVLTALHSLNKYIESEKKEDNSQELLN